MTTTTAEDTFALDTTYLHLDDGPDTEHPVQGAARARQIPVDDRFWEEIDRRSDLGRGRLVMQFTSTEDWGS